MARGVGVLCMSRWLQCFLGPQAFLTALGERHRFVARYITISGNKESKWWLKRWALRVWTELLWFLWKPCHLFWAAYENKVGPGAGFLWLWVDSGTLSAGKTNTRLYSWIIYFITQQKERQCKKCFRWQRISVNTKDLKKKTSGWVAGSPTQLWLWSQCFWLWVTTEKTRGPHFKQMQLSGKSLSVTLSLYYLFDSQLFTPEQCDVIRLCVNIYVTIVVMLHYSLTICYYYML